MYEVELISFVDHDAADTYASFTKVVITVHVRMYAYLPLVSHVDVFAWCIGYNI